MRFKISWINAPEKIAGVIVLFNLIFLIGLVCWYGIVMHSASIMKYLISAIIGGTLVYKALKDRSIKLDEERVIDGKLLIIIGCLSSVLFVVSILSIVLNVVPWK